MQATKSQETILTTATAAQMVGYSTQQVRDLERLGVIPAAERTPNGYRRYQERHIIALRAYRALAAAIGPVPARQMMPTLVHGTLEAAAEKIDDLHALLARSREHLREASRGLQAVLADTTLVFDDRDSMTISELADALGVRSSALRHWSTKDSSTRIGSVSRRPVDTTLERSRRHVSSQRSEAADTASHRYRAYSRSFASTD